MAALDGIFIQPVLLVPPDVQLGLLSGKFFRDGSVIRWVATGRIYKHLEEVPAVDRLAKAAAGRAAKLSPKLVVPAVGATAVVTAGAMLVLRRRRAAQRATELELRDTPECLSLFETALRAYVAAGQAGALEPAVVEDLIAALDGVTSWAEDGNAVTLSWEYLEPLLRLVIAHTPVLAEAYAVELDADANAEVGDGPAGGVVQLRDHLERQRRILAA